MSWGSRSGPGAQRSTQEWCRQGAAAVRGGRATAAPQRAARALMATGTPASGLRGFPAFLAASTSAAAASAASRLTEMKLRSVGCDSSASFR